MLKPWNMSPFRVKKYYIFMSSSRDATVHVLNEYNANIEKIIRKPIEANKKLAR